METFPYISPALHVQVKPKKGMKLTLCLPLNQRSRRCWKKGKEAKRSKAPKESKRKKDKKCKDKKAKGGKSKKSVAKKLKKDKKDKKVKKGKNAPKDGKPPSSKSSKPLAAKSSPTPTSQPVRRDLAKEMQAVATPQVASTQLDSQADPKNESTNVVGLVN